MKRYAPPPSPSTRAATLEPVAAIRGIGEKSSGGRRGARRETRAPLPVFALIATRNLLRNRKRSAITVFGAAFAIVAYVFLYGFFDGFGEQLVDNSTRYVTGHLQIEREGLRRDLAPELAFDARAALAAVRSQPCRQHQWRNSAAVRRMPTSAMAVTGAAAMLPVKIWNSAMNPEKPGRPSEVGRKPLCQLPRSRMERANP